MNVNRILRNQSRQHHVPLVDHDAKMEQYDYLLEVDGIHFKK